MIIIRYKGLWKEEHNLLSLKRDKRYLKLQIKNWVSYNPSEGRYKIMILY